jgi:hypothetical protein
MYINLRKVRGFIWRHKEAVVVAVFAIAVIHRQREELESLENFLYANRLEDAYCDYKLR